MRSAQEARDARRRRILSGSANRLAYITGEVPSISTPSPTSTTPTASSSPPAELPSPSARTGDAALIRLVDSGTALPGEAEISRASVPEEPDICSDRDHDITFSTRILKDVKEQLAALDLQDKPEPKSVPVSRARLKTSTSSENTTLTNANTKRDAEDSKEIAQVLPRKSLFTWETVGRSINVTENVRALWAVGFALMLVAQSVLSCIDDLGSFLSSWTPPWPVALVVVTDISLVLGAVLFGFVKPSHPGAAADDDFGVIKERVERALSMAGRLEFLLQVGAIFVKSLNALFLDCSLYLVVLITGLSLAQIWGPSFCLLVNV
ncbi:hypothetical protein R1flu_017021 [Riccia fluitans]|uniref:Transmembrane protein n=1 Tax=Riccia fluitans TaxID=41844 RepID=A0ABD1YPB5_9MARC